MSNKQSETALQNDILCALGQRIDALVWRNQVGKFRAIDDPRRVVSVGTRGSADILGVRSIVVGPELVGKTIGVAFAVEVKTPAGRLSPVQARWAQAWQARGGEHCVARSVEDAVDFLSAIGKNHDRDR